MDQVDHGDHDPPWWTRSVQDHCGPPYDIFLMGSGPLPESNHSPLCDQPGRRTQDSHHRDSGSGPSGLAASEQDRLRWMKTFVQANPFIVQLLRNPESVAPEPSSATLAPHPRPATTAPNTRGSHRPGCGHDSTMNSLSQRVTKPGRLSHD